MLIICPEYETELSQHTDKYVKCGFPIEDFITEHHLTDFEKLLYALNKEITKLSTRFLQISQSI